MKVQLDIIKERMNEAALQVGRKLEDLTLIAVSKTYPVEAIEEAVACGIVDFGENKVQELTGKIEALTHDVKWHLIGHLQTNKVKYIIGKVALIHSVDSIKLAAEIEKQSAKAGVVTPILIQINIAEEDSKFGFKLEEAEAVVREIATYNHVKVEGFMTIAPYVDDAEKNRHIFKKLYQLSVDMEKQNIDNISTQVLSMGMSNDFEVAIQEGATMIRIGTALFGERDYAHKVGTEEE
ncbi:MAG: YggS family pyridoxal phosphate-dependent enzyme [Cellulosilyticaceae bacterium]